MSPSQDELRGLQIPTLLVHGRDDKVIPADSSRKLAELISSATLDVVPECGHWVQIEKTDQFCELVFDALRHHRQP